MIPQEHIDEMQRGEQAPPPVEEQYTSAPASLRRWMDLLLHILGVIAPLVGGFVVFALPSAGIWVVQTIEGMVLVACLMALVGAILLRSWWALIVVPAALAVGQMLGAILPTILQGGGINLQAWAEQHFEPLDMVLFLGVLPAVLGAAIGTPIGKWLEQKLPR